VQFSSGLAHTSVVQIASQSGPAIKYFISCLRGRSEGQSAVFLRCNAHFGRTECFPEWPRNTIFYRMSEGGRFEGKSAVFLRFNAHVGRPDCFPEWPRSKVFYLMFEGEIRGSTCRFLRFNAHFGRPDCFPECPRNKEFYLMSEGATELCVKLEENATLTLDPPLRHEIKFFIAGALWEAIWATEVCVKPEETAR
jgi:hypothetical protein